MPTRTLVSEEVSNISAGHAKLNQNSNKLQIKNSFISTGIRKNFLKMHTALRKNLHSAFLIMFHYNLSYLKTGTVFKKTVPVFGLIEVIDISQHMNFCMTMCKCSER